MRGPPSEERPFQGRLRHVESDRVSAPVGRRSFGSHDVHAIKHYTPERSKWAPELSDASYLLRLQRANVRHETRDSLLYLAFMALTDARE